MVERKGDRWICRVGGEGYRTWLRGRERERVRNSQDGGRRRDGGEIGRDG